MTHDPLGLPIGRGAGLEAPPYCWHSIRRWLRAKEGGSSLEKGAAKTPPGCYSWAAALGKQISCESGRRAGRQGSELGVPEDINLMYNMITGG